MGTVPPADSSPTSAHPEARPTLLRITRPGSGLIHLHLDGARRRNVLGRATIAALDQAVRTLDRDARVVLLTAAGTDFCAGFDLIEAHDQGAVGFVGAAANFAGLRSCPVPVVAAVQGRAIGGGLELALTADIRVAARDATFSIPASELGLIYAEPGIRLLVETAGAATARAMLLGGSSLNARAARQCGLVSDLVTRRQLVDTARTIAERIAAFPAHASRGNRHMLDGISGRRQADFDQLHRSSFTTAELPEAIRRFAARRRRQASTGTIRR